MVGVNVAVGILEAVGDGVGVDVMPRSMGSAPISRPSCAAPFKSRFWGRNPSRT